MIDLPLRDPLLVFSVVMLLVLIAPLVVEKVRLPGIIGLIIAGVLFGPHLFGVLERDSTMELLGTIGLLYIMFQAGLQSDLEQLKRNRNIITAFGLLTFIIPMIMGITAAVYILEMDMTAAVLLGCMFASHTLITFPIVSRMGITKKRAVTTAVGGTVISTVLALLVLAFAVSGYKGDITAVYVLKLTSSILLYIVIVVFFLPWISAWFFKRFYSDDGFQEFIFILTALFVTAYFSGAAGLEPIIGAFLAGIIFTTLIPETSILMNRIRFVGSSLFIPFFLISVGMLVDPRVFITDINTVKVAAVMISVAVLSKFLSAYIFGKAAGYTSTERGLVFGISVNRAAFSLAAVMIGYRAGIFTEAVLSGTVMMIVVSSLIGSVLTRHYSRKIIMETEEETDFSKTAAPDRIMIPVKNSKNLNHLMDLSFLLHQSGSHEPLYPLYVAIEGEDEQNRIIEGETLLTGAVTRANSIQKPVIPLTKIDINVPSAILKSIKEHRISKVVLGWNDPESFTYTFFDTIIEQLVNNSDEMIFIAGIQRPLNTMKRTFIIIPPLISRQKGFKDTFSSLVKLSIAIGSRLTVIGEEATCNEIEKKLLSLASGTDVEFINVKSWKNILSEIEGTIEEDDLFIQIIARKGRPAWRLFFDRMPYRIRQRFSENNIIAVYPYNYIGIDGNPEPDGFSSREKSFLEKIPGKNFSLNCSEKNPAKVIEKIIMSEDMRDRPGIIKKLTAVLKEYPVEFSPEIFLVHLHTHRVDEYRIYIAVNPDGFYVDAIDLNPKIMIVLLSPSGLPPQKHLNLLSEISSLMTDEKTAEALISGEDYEDFFRRIGR